MLKIIATIIIVLIVVSIMEMAVYSLKKEQDEKEIEEAMQEYIEKMKKEK